MTHDERCQLAPGKLWADCLCAEIDPTDRPCTACEGCSDSALQCMECRREMDRREAAVSTPSNVVSLADWRTRGTK